MDSESRGLKHVSVQVGHLTLAEASLRPWPAQAQAQAISAAEYDSHIERARMLMRTLGVGRCLSRLDRRYATSPASRGVPAKGWWRCC